MRGEDIEKWQVKKVPQNFATLMLGCVLHLNHLIQNPFPMALSRIQKSQMYTVSLKEDKYKWYDILATLNSCPAETCKHDLTGN